MTTDEILDIRIRAARAMGWTQVETWRQMVSSANTFKVAGNDVWPKSYYVFAPDEHFKQATELAKCVSGTFEVRWNADGTCEARVYRHDVVAGISRGQESPALALTLAALQAAEGGEG